MEAMRHEYEAKFLSIDVAGLQATLRALGAAQAFPHRLLTRKIFESGALEAGAWIRLRDEGDFDTWPGLPTFVEVEGPDENSVRRAAAAVGLGYSQARFGSVDEIYRSELGRDILSEPALLFANADAATAPSAEVGGDCRRG
jgi:hypothetical protein